MMFGLGLCLSGWKGIDVFEFMFWLRCVVSILCGCCQVGFRGVMCFERLVFMFWMMF